MNVAWDVWAEGMLSGHGQAAAQWAASHVERARLRADALVVVTSDAGVVEALAFWDDAGRTGFRFANPSAFPWTLANSPAGHISAVLGITGPVTTLVGGDEEAERAWREIRDAHQPQGTTLLVALRQTTPLMARARRMRVAAVIHRPVLPRPPADAGRRRP